MKSVQNISRKVGCAQQKLWFWMVERRGSLRLVRATTWVEASCSEGKATFWPLGATFWPPRVGWVGSSEESRRDVAAYPPLVRQ